MKRRCHPAAIAGEAEARLDSSEPGRQCSEIPQLTTSRTGSCLEAGRYWRALEIPRGRVVLQVVTTRSSFARSLRSPQAASLGSEGRRRRSTVHLHQMPTRYCLLVSRSVAGSTPIAQVAVVVVLQTLLVCHEGTAELPLVDSLLRSLFLARSTVSMEVQ